MNEDDNLNFDTDFDPNFGGNQNQKMNNNSWEFNTGNMQNPNRPGQNNYSYNGNPNRPGQGTQNNQRRPNKHFSPDYTSNGNNDQSTQTFQNIQNTVKDTGKQISDSIDDLIPDNVSKEKTKLGISKNLFKAIAYGATWLSGILAGLLLIGYSYIGKEDNDIKRATIKATLTRLAFSLLFKLTGIISDALSVIEEPIEVIKSTFYIPVIPNMVSFVNSIISIIEAVTFILLVVKSLKGQEIRVSAVDKIVDQYTDLNKPND